MDVSGRILRAWMPAIHAGMTEAADGQASSNIGVGVEGCNSFSCFVGERKLMTHFVVLVDMAIGIDDFGSVHGFSFLFRRSCGN